MNVKENKGIRKSTISRRGFIEITAKAAGSLLFLPSNLGLCASYDQAQSITITLRYINHTRGMYGEQKMKVLAGSTITVTTRDIDGGFIDEKRIAVREGEGFGKFIAFSDSGKAVFTAPNGDTTFEIYGFNIKSGADYSLIDNDTFAGEGAQLYKGKHFFTVRRKDWNEARGPEYIWRKIFSQLNHALKYKWATYGHINRKPKANVADFSYGYGIPSDHPNSIGWHQGDRLYVRPNLVSVAIFRVGLAETFETICQVDDIGGKSSYHKIWDGGYGLSRIGRDLFAYVFVKE
jgi:hypothetical protein